MKRVIAFSLYKAPKDWEIVNETNYMKYITGLKANLELAEKYYPGWYVYLYYNKNFDVKLFDELKGYPMLVPKLIEDYSVSAMQWRFLPHDEDDVELFISRDLDSRITKREVVSVNEWIESGKMLHVMRDHPHHNYYILGGMWGMRKEKGFNMTESCRNWNKTKNYSPDSNWYDKWWDMNFLEDVIWTKFYNNVYENASFYCKTDTCRQFTEEWDDRHFVGEIFLENGERWFHYAML